jgi:hypothetical protein
MLSTGFGTSTTIRSRSLSRSPPDAGFAPTSGPPRVQDVPVGQPDIEQGLHGVDGHRGVAVAAAQPGDRLVRRRVRLVRQFLDRAGARLAAGECRPVRRQVRRPARNRTIPVFPPPGSRTSGMRAEQTWPGRLPGVWWGAVAVDDRAVGALDLAGAVGVDGEGPAELVQDHVVVPPAVIFEVGEAGGAAIGPVGDVVGFAAGGGLAAAAGMLP